MNEIDTIRTGILTPSNSTVGSAMNGAAWISGGALGKGYGYYMTGSPGTGKIFYPSSAPINVNNGTVSMWINGSNVAIGAGSFQCLFWIGSGIGADMNGPETEYYMQWDGATPNNGSGRVRFAYYSGTALSGINLAAAEGATATWHHAAINWQNGSMFQLFFNGAEIGSVMAVPINSEGTIRNEIYFGTPPSNTTRRGFAGTIDDIRIYNVTLANGLIGSLASKVDCSGTLDNLKLWLKLDESGSNLTTAIYNSADCNISYFSPTANGEIEKIELLAGSTLATIGSIIVGVSGTTETIMRFQESGISASTALYPCQYGKNSSNIAGSPWTQEKPVVNGPLWIWGSGLIADSTISGINITYKGGEDT